jgi:hypothetical protein
LVFHHFYIRQLTVIYFSPYPSPYSVHVPIPFPFSFVVGIVIPLISEFSAQ